MDRTKDMTLNEIGVKHRTDKSSSVDSSHDYLRRYAPFFTQLILNSTAPIKVLEIGIFHGASLRTWREYFDTGAGPPEIYGVDTNPEYVNAMQGQDAHIIPILGDASNPEFWSNIKDSLGGGFDMIIDDGSHISDHIVSTFQSVWSLIRLGGLYVCEDLHSSYSPGHSTTGGASAVEFFKKLIDEMNTFGEGLSGAQKPGESYDWIHFSKSFVIIKKRA